MGREVRRVPENWEHPKEEDGKYKPLNPAESFDVHMEDWRYEKQVANEEGHTPEYIEQIKPDRENNYMPEWSDGEATHYQMYETTSEGKPISPVMESPEKLASWLTENKASAFAGQEATYEDWLSVCKGKYAVTGFVDKETGASRSGVAGPEQDKTGKKDYIDALLDKMQEREDAKAENAHERDNSYDRDGR